MREVGVIVVHFYMLSRHIHSFTWPLGNALSSIKKMKLCFMHVHIIFWQRHLKIADSIHNKPKRVKLFFW